MNSIINKSKGYYDIKVNEKMNKIIEKIDENE